MKFSDIVLYLIGPCIGAIALIISTQIGAKTRARSDKNAALLEGDPNNSHDDGLVGEFVAMQKRLDETDRLAAEAKAEAIRVKEVAEKSHQEAMAEVAEAKRQASAAITGLAECERREDRITARYEGMVDLFARLHPEMISPTGQGLLKAEPDAHSSGGG